MAVFSRYIRKKRVAQTVPAFPFKGTPSLARPPLSQNNSPDCFAIHPLRSAFDIWALPKPAKGAASGHRQRNTFLWNPVHTLI